jgi:hypothetical protein
LYELGVNFAPCCVKASRYFTKKALDLPLSRVGAITKVAAGAWGWALLGTNAVMI